MALSDEQRALLQLLLEGEQGYEDIGSLLGITPDEARSRARGALREIGGADPDSHVPLSDYLLGQADPIGRADAVRHLQADAADNELASRLVAQLRLIAPRAELPEIPEPRGGRGAPAPASAPGSGRAEPGAAAEPSAPRGVRGISQSKRQSQLLVGLGALALLIVVGVLAIAGVFGGGDDDGEGDTTASTSTDAAGSDSNRAVVRLSPIDGASGASGEAVLAPAQNQAVLEINLSGLEPTGEGEIYVVWLYGNDASAFPIARDRVDDSGTLTGATPLGVESIALLAQLGCIDVSLASTGETERAIRQAVKGGSLPRYTGATALRGEIPSVPGQEAPTGADSQCEVAQQPAAGGGGQGGGQAGAQGGQGGAQ